MANFIVDAACAPLPIIRVGGNQAAFPQMESKIMTRIAEIQCMDCGEKHTLYFQEPSTWIIDDPTDYLHMYICPRSRVTREVVLSKSPIQVDAVPPDAILAVPS